MRHRTLKRGATVTGSGKKGREVLVAHFREKKDEAGPVHHAPYQSTFTFKISLDPVMPDQLR